MFRFGPGKNSAEVYVTKFVNLTRTMEPALYLWLVLTPSCIGALGWDRRRGADAMGGGGVSSEEEFSSSCGAIGLRIRLLSLGAVDEGVFGLE